MHKLEQAASRAQDLLLDMSTELFPAAEVPAPDSLLELKQERIKLHAREVLLIHDFETEKAALCERRKLIDSKEEEIAANSEASRHELTHSVSIPVLSASFSILNDRRPTPKTVEQIYEARQLDKELGKRTLQKSKSSMFYLRGIDAAAHRKEKSQRTARAALQHRSFNFQGICFDGISLNLSGRKLVDQDLHELSALLTEDSSPVAEVLILSDNYLCGREVEAGHFEPGGLNDLFRSTACAAVVDLDISRVLLGGAGARILADIFSSGFMLTLKILVLDGNFIGGHWKGDAFIADNDALTMLLRWLPPGLTGLSLQNNRIGNSRKTLPSNQLASQGAGGPSSWVKLLTSGRLSNLRKLNLAENVIGGCLDEDGDYTPMPLAAVELFATLSTRTPILAPEQHFADKGPLHQQLEEIDLSSNNLGTNLAEQLIDDDEGSGQRPEESAPKCTHELTRKIEAPSPANAEGDGRCGYCVQHELFRPAAYKSTSLGRCNSCQAPLDDNSQGGGGNKKAAGLMMGAAAGRRESFDVSMMVNVATKGGKLLQKLRANRAAGAVLVAKAAAAAAVAAAATVLASAASAVAAAVSVTGRSGLQLGRMVGALSITGARGMCLCALTLSDTKLRAHDLVSIAKGIVEQSSLNDDKPLLIRSLNLSENPICGFYQTCRVRRRRISTKHGALALRAILSRCSDLTELNLNDTFLGGFIRSNAVGSNKDHDSRGDANSFPFAALAASNGASASESPPLLFARILSVADRMYAAGSFGQDAKAFYAALVAPCIAPTPTQPPASSLGVGVGFTAKLTKLDVSRNGIDSSGLAALLDLLDRCRLLQELNLSQNPIGTAVFTGSDTGITNSRHGAVERGTGLIGSLVEKLQQQHQRLRFLNLSCCSLGRADIAEFSGWLGGCNVRALDLTENHFSDVSKPVQQRAAVCIVEALRNDIGIEELTLVKGRPIPVLAVRRWNTELNAVDREKAKRARVREAARIARTCARTDAEREVKRERSKRGTQENDTVEANSEAEVEKEVAARTKAKLDLITAKAQESAAKSAELLVKNKLDSKESAKVEEEGKAALLEVLTLMKPPIGTRDKLSFGDATEAAVLEFLAAPKASAMQASECLRSLLMLWPVEAGEWEKAWAADKEAATEVMIEFAWRLFTPNKSQWAQEREREREQQQAEGGRRQGKSAPQLLEPQYLRYWWQSVFPLPLFAWGAGWPGKPRRQAEKSAENASRNLSAEIEIVGEKSCYHSECFALMRRVQSVAVDNMRRLRIMVDKRTDDLLEHDRAEEDNKSHAQDDGKHTVRAKLVDLQSFRRVSRQDHESVRAICPTVDFKLGTMALAPPPARGLSPSISSVLGEPLSRPMPMRPGSPQNEQSYQEQLRQQSYREQVDLQVYLPLLCAKAKMIDAAFQERVRVTIGNALKAHQQAIASGSYTARDSNSTRSRTQEVTAAALGSCSDIDIQVTSLPPLSIEEARDALAQSASDWPRSASLTSLNRCVVACSSEAAALKCALGAFGAWPQVMGEGTGVVDTGCGKSAELEVVGLRNSFSGLNGTCVDEVAPHYARSKGRQKREAKQAEELLAKHGLGVQGGEEIDAEAAVVLAKQEVEVAKSGTSLDGLPDMMLSVVMRSGEQRMVCEVRVVDAELLAIEEAHEELRQIQRALEAVP
jgi:hypothetical protein